jgi:hypothetical protein
VDVLPEDGLISYCKGNGTTVYDNLDEMMTNGVAAFANTNWDLDTIGEGTGKASMEAAIVGLQGLLSNSYGLSYNCYYSYKIGTS